MTVVEGIRRLDAEGVPGREIARRLGVSRDSVAKYVQADDFSPAAPATAPRAGQVELGHRPTDPHRKRDSTLHRQRDTELVVFPPVSRTGRPECHHIGP